jgi:hypothetical protein
MERVHRNPAEERPQSASLHRCGPHRTRSGQTVARRDCGGRYSALTLTAVLRLSVANSRRLSSFWSHNKH